MESRSVPLELFPINESKIDDEWAMDTIQYRNVFSNTGQIAIATEDNLKEWQVEAKKICEELKVLGTLKAEERIVHLCHHTYGLRLPENKEITNMYQVIEFMSSRQYFTSNYNSFLDLLHMFQYGIFRMQFNGWAQDASNEWMLANNIKYSSIIDIKGLRKKRGKGFVYKLLVSRASNTICVRLQKLTERLFGEYIVVRDRKSKKIANSGRIIEHTFNNTFHGYIVRFQVVEKNSNNVLTSEESREVCRFVTKAMDKGIPIKVILEVLDKLSQSTPRGTY